VEVTNCKNKLSFFGTAREGGFTLDVFLEHFFDIFLAKTELQHRGKPLKNRPKKAQKMPKKHQKTAT
jgi:hypothetical protein